MKLAPLSRTCMRSRPILCWGIACLLLPFTPWAAAQEPAVAPAPDTGLEELADRFQNAGAPVVKKAEEMLALVEAEVDAKRISEPIAKGLRWTLEHVSADGEGDFAELLDSTRMPSGNAAILEAARLLDESRRGAEIARVLLRGCHALY